MYGDASMQVTPDSPPPDNNSGENGESGGNNYWVEGIVSNQEQAGGIGCTDLSFFVYTDSVEAKKDISVRYYFDTAGMSDISAIQLRQTYDQCETETEFDGVLTGPKQYKDSIYYIEITWDGYVIANSNKKYQLQIGAWSTPWDTSDDWSMKEMLEIDQSSYNGYQGEMQIAPNMCVYSDGVLIGGTEPDGTTPVVPTEPTEPETEPTTVPTEPTTNTKPSEDVDVTVPNGVEATLYGDVNVDGKVNVADVVNLNGFLLDASKSPVTEIGMANADCIRDNIIDISDSSIILNFVGMMIEQNELGAK
jgi:hypothetical protein